MTIQKIAIAGSAGRMGQALLEAVTQAGDMQLCVALEQNDSPYLDKDSGELIGSSNGIRITHNYVSALVGCHQIIDFTRPAGTLAHLAACREAGVKMIVGTTGFSTTEKEMLKAASKDIAIVFAPNMSVGVNVTFKLLEIAAKVLNQGYDIEIIEAHHRHKIDAPSGTALRMGEVIAEATNRDLKKVAIYGREGVTGERADDTIGFSTIRAGDIVGEHTAMFAGTGERIEIVHKASSRMTFAMGAIRAVRFLKDKPNGLFDMQDVLGLR
ncbi:4-hydroxy-tetrahydrodipicolinate reductase [Nitrosomonas aestuarii]|uniref:4-hydroxy-tetrahydrodipicolinate reductase n=1 Tax=Nitrosomonas aestuarii TaxID=52441 RepID=UPI000D313259|nr:4-hydroxy-tetrahydrodipicolinate reductase [Nitrosomonas aestuarii]PTN11264.1 dihydrodipicolinate reductase [Nitrosomonas aestuarii]